MRLLFLTIEFSIATFSGNGVYATSQVRALQQLGHEVLVVCGCPANSSSAILQDHSPDVISIPLPIWGRLDLECAWREFAEGCGEFSIANRIGNFHAEAIIGVDWHSFEAYERLAASLQFQNFPVPSYFCSNYRVYLRSAQSDHEKETIRQLEGASLKRSLSSSVLSRSDANFVKLHYFSDAPSNTIQPPPRLHVLLPALRSDIAALPMPENPPRRKYLTCCVRASPEKEPHRFINLISELQRRGVFEKLNIVPLIAGAGWGVDFNALGNNNNSSNALTSVQKYARDLRIRIKNEVPSCRVIETFLGPSEMVEIYSETALNFHPPAYDAYGMTIVEAASQGAPSLAAHQGHVGATDLLDPGKNQIFVTDMEADVADLADVVEGLLKDQRKLIEVGVAAAEVARAWTEASNAASLVEMLQASLDDLSFNNEEEKANGSPSEIPRTIELVREQRGSIDVIPASSLDYVTFEQHYLAQHRPVILTGITDNWRATKDWVLPGGGVNVDFLEKHFGNSKVVATDTAPRHQGAGPCQDLTLGEYIHWWKGRKEKARKKNATAHKTKGGEKRTKNGKIL